MQLRCLGGWEGEAGPGCREGDAKPETLLGVDALASGMGQLAALHSSVSVGLPSVPCVGIGVHAAHVTAVEIMKPFTLSDCAFSHVQERAPKPHMEMGLYSTAWQPTHHAQIQTEGPANWQRTTHAIQLLMLQAERNVGAARQQPGCMQRAHPAPKVAAVKSPPRALPRACGPAARLPW